MPSDADRTVPRSGVFFCGDDLVTTECADTRSAHALADHLRESGEWLECVAGIASCVAQFDLAATSAEEAAERMASALPASKMARVVVASAILSKKADKRIVILPSSK